METEFKKLDLTSVNNELRNKVLDEEEQRRILSNTEISVLENYFKQNINSKDLDTLTKKLIEEKLPLLIQQAKTTNEALKDKISVDIPKNSSEETYQLKTNKNLELLEYTFKILQQNPNFLQDLYTNGYENSIPSGKPINLGKIANFDDIDDNLGNSYRSAVILTLLSSLSIIKGKTISELIEQDLSEVGIGTINENSEIVQLQQGVFQSEESPCIQTCNLYDQTLEPTLQKNEMYSLQKKGLYSGIGGYFFGGSDVKDKDKEQRFEDCSSAASKWLKTSRFSTADLQQYFENIDMPEEEQTFIYKEIAKKINPIQNIGDLKEGDIICWRTFNPEKKTYVGGHVGIITDIQLPKIGLISYSRDVPKVEGIGYMSVDIFDKSKNRKFMFFREKEKELSMAV